MSSIDIYFEWFNKKVPLTNEEMEIIRPYLHEKKLRKKQFILQEGDACKQVAFVAKGVLRKYFINDHGGEGITQFAIEGWTISDLYSWLTGEPSQFNIDALEDSELVLMDKPSMEELYIKVPKLETHARKQLTNAYIASERRIASMMGMSLEDRYEEINKLHPDIVQRVPQHMLASYMGLTPETLSRVRKRMSSSK
ncbi:MAG TPA: Crp/Fnr family transcriptional regulator [Ohtaekwangia sp.]|nr:Crp/Fnr family transcriptional regulator [Ohtaekwangia sp.]